MSTPIILDCEQGSPEWEAARLGVATASMCSKILTPTGRLSSARDEYVGKLLAEWALGEPVEEFMRHLPHGARQGAGADGARALPIPA